MARSLKKGPFVHHSLEKKVIKNVEENKKSVIKTWSRASLITPDFVGQTIGVHNGKTFVPVYVCAHIGRPAAAVEPSVNSVVSIAFCAASL